MKKRPTVALIYDFDGTLSPGNMQEFGFIQAIGQTPDEFWSKSNSVPDGQEVSSILSYMKLMIDEARKKGISLTRDSFVSFGKHIQLYEGVQQWFALINEYNGWLLLPVLSAVSQIAMTKIMGTNQAQPQPAQGQGQAPNTGKFMQYFFPVFSLIICLSYSAAFALYWVAGNLVSMGQTFAINKYLDKKEAAAGDVVGKGSVK
jgi:hypothetical protein